MRCVVCADSDAEMDEEFGAALCDSCYERIENYEDEERAELIEGLRGLVSPARAGIDRLEKSGVFYAWAK